MKFPDFIIIGAMKCGTTVLWHNLNKHPGINMCKNWEDPKSASTEIRFWNNGLPYKTWEKGIDWYKSLFSGECCGEKSANYIEEFSTMKRMSKYLPNIKLILNIRNPIDRAYSEYQMQYGKVKQAFNVDMANKKGYLYRGCYYKQLINNVLPFFSKNNLYIIIQERMKEDTDNELNSLYNFLGVDTYRLGVEETTAEIATNRNLDLVKDGAIKSYKVWDTKYEPLSANIRKELAEYYKIHNDNLFELLGYTIKEWS